MKEEKRRGGGKPPYARVIDENTHFSIPRPMSQERLEEILLDYGLLQTVDDYII